MMIKKRYVEKYVCTECEKDFEVQCNQLNKRHFRSGEHICQECYRKISKGGKYLDFYPDELKNISKDEILEYEKIKHLFDKLKGCKRKVKFICQECAKESIMTISMMSRRKICGYKPICTKCSLKFATNSEQWIDSNSKAQYIAQNRPEVLEKQRQSQLKLMANDPLYAEKRSSKSYVSGTIRGMRFDSSWELYFLGYCWESSDIIDVKRYDGSIEYFDLDGKNRLYYPDFIVNYVNGTSKIIEIKGSKKYNHFHEKFNAARKKHGNNYLVLEMRDLLDMGIYLTRESYLKEFYKKYNNEIIFYNNEKVDNIKARIAEWLK